MLITHLPPPPATLSPPTKADEPSLITTGGKRSGASNRPITLPFEILIDDRERAGGWRFLNLRGDSRDNYRPLVVSTFELHLETADYVVTDEEPGGVTGRGCYIERKSHADVIGSIGRGHDRLRREHERLAALVAAGSTAYVIVESDLGRIVADCEAGACGLSANAILGVVASWTQRYGVHWLFASTRGLAEQLALKIFRQWWAERAADATREREQQKRSDESCQETSSNCLTLVAGEVESELPSASGKRKPAASQAAGSGTARKRSKAKSRTTTPTPPPKTHPSPPQGTVTELAPWEGKPMWVK